MQRLFFTSPEWSLNWFGWPTVGVQIEWQQIKIFCYVDENALLVPIEFALQFMFNTHAPKLENSTLKINVEKSCNILFKNKSNRTSTNLTVQGQLLEQACECVYLGIELMDNIACTTYMERSKRTFLK